MGVGTFALLALLLAASGCKKGEDEAVPAPRPVEAPKTPPPTAPAKSIVDQSLLDQAASCTLGQRGLVIDLGDPIAEARRGFSLAQHTAPTLTTREGESFRRLDEMGTDFAFWLTEPLENFELNVRLFGLSSERMAAYVDGQRLGARKIVEGKTQTLVIDAQGRKLDAGRHMLTLALSRPRGGSPEADVSWVRLGARSPGALSEQDFPATRREMFSEVTIGKERLRSIVLRPEGNVRCSIWVPERTRFVARTGIWGEGPGEVEIVAHTTKGERFVLSNEVREEDEPRDFRELTADLGRFGSQFIDLEISAPHSLERARVVVGEPRLVSEETTRQSAPHAKRALLVVLSGLGEKHAPPAASAHGLPLVNQLAREGVYYPSYRTTSTSVSAVIASLFTGTAPWVHGVSSNKALSRERVTLASAIEGAGGRTGFFTSVPFSFSPLGFDRGFGTFDSFAPQDDIAATAPISQAKKWLKKHLAHEGPVLGVLHLRGGHPPFDVSKDAAMELPPAEYGGSLTPRRAAIQLADIRARRSERHRQMPEEDWKRLAALQKRALLNQSAELSDLFEWLRREGVYDDTLIVVVGDVAAGEIPLIPFADDAPIDEGYLATPLIVKFPRGFSGGTTVPGYFAPRDITETLASSLRVSFDADDSAIDLSRSDSQRRALLRAHVAYRDGAYSLRLGDSILMGQDGKPPRFCLPTLDPICATDRSDSHVLESRALWFVVYETLRDSLSTPASATAVEADEAFKNSLIVWGARL